jgi:hypothetical protein
MSLNKGIRYGKEDREDYRGSKRFDKTCRNNGSCNHCRSDRSLNRLGLRDLEKLLEEEENVEYGESCGTNQS